MSAELMLFMKKKIRRLEKKLDNVKKHLDAVPIYVAGGEARYSINSYSFNELVNNLLEIIDYSELS